MRKTNHSIKASYCVTSIKVEVLISFTFLRGAPAHGPSYSSGGQPADPDEVELVGVKVPMPLSQEYMDGLTAWAEEWLTGEGWAEVMETVASDDEAAREAAAELRMDR